MKMVNLNILCLVIIVRFKSSVSISSFYMSRGLFTTKPQPQLCCAPNTWEAKVAQLPSDSASEISDLNFPMGRVSYDFTKPAVRFSLVTRNNNAGRISYSNTTFLVLGKEAYFVDDTQGTCRQYTWPPSSPQLCVFKGSKLALSPVFGIGGLKTNVFTGSRESFFGTLRYAVTVTDKECAPVSTIVHGMQRNSKVNLDQFYFDITPGIKDESVFKVPSQCQSAGSTYELIKSMSDQMIAMSEPFFFFDNENDFL